ncbi:MAG: hypothetical protein K2X87_07690 [Gemmataceae bacterium]|nr:hypothetical protein [Gemmataceae bacterium]
MTRSRRASARPPSGARSVERLEDRTVPAGRPLVYDAPAAGVLVVQVRAAAVEVVGGATAAVLARRPVAEVAGVRVNGNGFDVSLRIDASARAVPGEVHFDGGSGSNALLGPADAATWRVTGPGAGSIVNTRPLTFSGVEQLRGAAGNTDDFRFAPGGRLAGTVDGGPGGFDAVALPGGVYGRVEFTATAPDAGTIVRDGNLLTYAGMEPVTVADAVVSDRVITATALALRRPAGATDRLVLDSDTDLATMESHEFPDPTNSLTVNLGSNPAGSVDRLTVGALGAAGFALTVDGGAGRDAVRLEGDADLGGRDLAVTAEVIEVTNAARDVDLAAGDITLTAVGDEAGLSAGSNLPLDIVDSLEGDRRITVDTRGTVAGRAVTFEASRVATLVARSGRSAAGGRMSRSR